MFSSRSSSATTTLIVWGSLNFVVIRVVRGANFSTAVLRFVGVVAASPVMGREYRRRQDARLRGDIRGDIAHANTTAVPETCADGFPARLGRKTSCRGVPSSARRKLVGKCVGTTRNTSCTRTLLIIFTATSQPAHARRAHAVRVERRRLASRCRACRRTQRSLRQRHQGRP